MTAPVRVAITGATGQVAYALIPRIAAGEMFGPGREVDIRLVDIPQMTDKANGVLMELEDGAYPLLARASATTERNVGFKDADWVLLVGSKPRGPGMERGDLIKGNGPIFVADGKAIGEHAGSGVRVAVIGNPCNTNCLIARHAAGDRIPSDRWTALTRLDQNRARALLAGKAGVHVSQVKRLAIWGNHSATLYPDFTNAQVGGKPAGEIVDRAWLEAEFMSTVQLRGAAVIAARGASSAFSAAQAILDHVKSLVTPTPADDWFSAAVYSDGSYGIAQDIVASLPLRSKGDGSYEIVKGIALNAFAQDKVSATITELQREREIVKDLLAAA